MILSGQPQTHHSRGLWDKKTREENEDGRAGMESGYHHLPPLNKPKTTPLCPVGPGGKVCILAAGQSVFRGKPQVSGAEWDNG